MKKNIVILVLLLIAGNTFAKKVKFAADFSGQIISPNGLHVTGDFQTLAGFSGGDWQSNTTTLTQEGSSNIYSIVVDIPAFAKYEYKFVNGDQFYEAEFVPVESRVGYLFNDNRWIYVDSLSNDTSFVGAILFGGNAPAGLTLVRFLVDMQGQTVSPNGVHMAGNFQGWDPAQTILYNFDAAVYEVIAYVTTGTYEYKYYNGNITGTEEVIPGVCSVNSNREIVVSADIVLPAVCFGACAACTSTGIKDQSAIVVSSLYPNPVIDYATLEINDQLTMHTIYLTDLNGRIVRNYQNYSGNTLKIEKEGLSSGTYFVKISNERNQIASTKLIIQ